MNWIQKPKKEVRYLSTVVKIIKTNTVWQSAEPVGSKILAKAISSRAACASSLPTRGQLLV